MWLVLTAGIIPSLILVVLIFFNSPTTVNAHAAYVRSEPQANSTLPAGQPPKQVQVWFAENIEGRFSELSVINSTDSQVDVGDSHVVAGEPDTLAVTLKPDLPDGTYTVNFKSASADDGHISQGAFTFNVGAGTRASLPVEATENTAASSADNLNFWTVSLRSLNYLMAAILMGGFTFALLVWKNSAGRLAESPKDSQMDDFEESYGLGLRQIRRLAWIGLWGLVVSWVGWVLYQSVTLSGQNLAQLSGLAPGGAGPKALINLLFSTRYGIIWMARLGIIFFLFDALVLLLPEINNKVKKETRTASGSAPEKQKALPTENPDAAGKAKAPALTAAEPGQPETPLSRRQRQIRLYIHSTDERALWWWSVITLSACILLTQSLTSHAASQQGYPWLTIIVDWVHLLSTSIWVGGLIALAAVLAVTLPAFSSKPGDRTRLLALLIPSFSRLALIAMATLILTGTISAATELTDPGQLFSTSYGWCLSVKIILLVLLLGLGSYNLLVISPKMRDYAGKKNITQKDPASKGVYRLTLNFRRTVLLEITLAVLAFLAAAFLTSNPPPRSLNQSADGQARAQFLQQAVQLQPDLVPVIISFREKTSVSG